MRYQDYVIETTQEAFQQVFSDARFIQEDKMIWSPLGEGRTVLNILQELAKCPDWTMRLLLLSRDEHDEELKDSSSREKRMEEFERERMSWTDLETCYAAGKTKLQAYLDHLHTFPDERLKETKWLMYDGGREVTAKEQMTFPMWNYMYHQGQINYIETLYGDKSLR